MDWFIGVGVLPACAVAAWLIVQGPARRVLEGRHDDRARALFRQRREWLEARFLAALDPAERLRWEDAHWHDEVVWARDRQTRRLLALVGVHFDANPFDGPSSLAPRHATALFEFRKGRWFAEGKRLDAIRPDEAFLRLQRFEPVASPQRRA